MNQQIVRSGAICFSLIFSTALFGQVSPGNYNLVSRSDWVRFDIMGGRITAHQARYTKEKSASIQKPDSDCRECLSVNNGGGRPNVKYRRVDASHELTIVITDGTSVSIHRRRMDGSTSEFAFGQQNDGQNLLTVATPAGKVSVSSTSFWHLMLAESELCEKHLIPVLLSLRSDWQLHSCARRIHQELLDGAKLASIPLRRDLDVLVRQLGDHSFQKRRAADRQIRDLGSFAYDHLKHIRQSRISSEQSRRVAEIIKSMSREVADTPQNVAARMAADRAVYVTLLDEEIASYREIAHVHLQRLCDMTLTFDPSADADTRQRQTADIKKKLGIRN